MADLRMVMADAEALLQATVDQGDEKMEAARAKARESLRLVGARLVQTQDSLLVRSQEAIKATQLYVHEKPWSALAIAGGVGLLAGLILRRG
jgi:ElaB/YqjD/DUF883 family membrane-anchored ribosome-binding protein